MNLFKNYTFTWWQVGVLKLSVFCIALAIGASWPEVFAPHAELLALVGIALGLYLAFVYFGKK